MVYFYIHISVWLSPYTHRVSQDLVTALRCKWLSYLEAGLGGNEKNALHKHRNPRPRHEVFLLGWL